MQATSEQDPLKESQEPILVLEHIRAGYSNRIVLHDACLSINSNQIVVLCGDNGAGKSTVLKVIVGLLQIQDGTVRFKNQPITGFPPHVVQEMGIGYLSQGGRVFVNLTVGQNIEMAARRAHQERICHSSLRDQILFPCLRDKWNMRAGLLSGGDRKTLAFQMVWIQKPLLLLLDEPMAGLAPDLASEVIEYINEFASIGDQAVLLIEQNSGITKSIRNRCFMLKNGIIVANPDLT